MLSGGNIDPLLLGKVIRHGMAAAGRYLNLHGPHPRPCPAAWPRCSPSSATAGANVLEVVHERISPTCTSTRSRSTCSSRPAAPAHAEQVLARLRERGYRVFE